MNRNYLVVSFLLTVLVCCFFGGTVLAFSNFITAEPLEIAAFTAFVLGLVCFSHYYVRYWPSHRITALRSCLFGITCAIGFCYSSVLILDGFLWACLVVRM